jgi:hypothetical protein
LINTEDLKANKVEQKIHKNIITAIVIIIIIIIIYLNRNNGTDLKYLKKLNLILLTKIIIF